MGSLVCLLLCLPPEHKGGDLYHRLQGTAKLSPHGDGHGRVFPLLTWGHRFRIAVHLFRALEYLHCSSGSPVVHRDVKSLNILIDAEGQAKLADFGTVRELWLGVAGTMRQQTHASTKNVIGTREYCPPEYTQRGHVSHKLDAYSAGIVLLELLTGKFPSDYDLRDLVDAAIAECEEAGTGAEAGAEAGTGQTENDDSNGGNGGGGVSALAKVLDTRAGIGDCTAILPQAMAVAKIAVACTEQAVRVINRTRTTNPCIGLVPCGDDDIY